MYKMVSGNLNFPALFLFCYLLLTKKNAGKFKSKLPKYQKIVDFWMKTQKMLKLRENSNYPKCQKVRENSNFQNPIASITISYIFGPQLIVKIWEKFVIIFEIITTLKGMKLGRQFSWIKKRSWISWPSSILPCIEILSKRWHARGIFFDTQ